MKTLLAAVVAVMLAGALAAQAPAAKKGAAGKAAKKEEAPKIEGQEIRRHGEGYMGLIITDGRFKLSFYGKDRKPVPPDVKSAVLRWQPNYKSGEERVLLTPGGGENTLTSERIIRPPYNFKLFMTLLQDPVNGAYPPGENYVVDFMQ